MIQTRQLPDVLNIDDWVAYANQQLLHPASDVLDPQVQSDFLASFTKNGELNGTQYGIPFIASVRALGYNQKVFSDIGVQSPPKSWQELEETARKAKAKGYTGYGLPLGAEEAQAEFSLFMWGNGGDWKQGDSWTINSAQNVAALEFMKKLADERLTEPNPGKTNRTDGVWKLFAQGKVSMAAIMPLGTFANSTMKDATFEWSSAPSPVNQGVPAGQLPEVHPDRGVPAGDRVGERGDEGRPGRRPGHRPAPQGAVLPADRPQLGQGPRRRPQPARDGARAARRPEEGPRRDPAGCRARRLSGGPPGGGAAARGPRSSRSRGWRRACCSSCW
jgi:hypothetical protein